MPIDSNDLYQDFIATANTFQGGFYPPVSTFIRVANDISNEMWEKKTAEAENNQQFKDDLQPFLKTKNCIVSNVNLTYGLFDNPKDYGQYSSAGIALYQGKTIAYDDLDCVTCSSKKEEDEEEKYQMINRYLDGIVEHDVKSISNSKWRSCLSSVTKPPTLQSPKITQTTNGYKVAPRNISVIILDYYTPPIPATYAFTTVPGNPQTGSGDQIIYNASASVPFQWNKNLINEFIWNLLLRFGIYTRDQFLTQISNAKVK